MAFRNTEKKKKRKISVHYFLLLALEYLSPPNRGRNYFSNVQLLTVGGKNIKLLLLACFKIPIQGSRPRKEECSNLQHLFYVESGNKIEMNV